MKISIIIPAYNVGAYLAEALTSALEQNPPFYEVIVVNDGSTDDVLKIVKTFNDSRIRYHYQRNSGLGPARNTGIEMASGEFIYFMDGDDVLIPGLNAAFQDVWQENKDLDLFAFSALDFEHGTNRKLPTGAYMQRRRSCSFVNGRFALIDGLSRKNFPVCAFLYIFRRSALNKKTPLRFLNILHEDVPFTAELFLRCQSTVVSEDIFYRRRVRPNSIMTTPAGAKNVTGYMIASGWWRDTANAATVNEARLFRREAQHFYALAMLYAGRACMPFQEVRSLVKVHIPEFLQVMRLDFALMHLSRRLAFEFIKARSFFG